MGENLRWLILASEIKQAKDNINLQISMFDYTIPNELLHSMSGMGMISNEFDVLYNGNFGFETMLTMQE